MIEKKSQKIMKKNWKIKLSLFFESLELDDLNKIVIDINLDNLHNKSFLINYFGESICFTYPNNTTKSKMLFSRNVHAGETAESLSSKTDDDVIIACAKIMREECN